jgi:tRNA(fMet)-specific endonuclease VapC
MYLLDTDHVVILQTRPPGEFDRLVNRMNQHPASGFHIPIVAFHEQMLGWNVYISRAQDSDGVVRGYHRMYGLLEYFRDAQVVEFDSAAASHFDHLRGAVRIGTMDLRIAAIALSQDMTVLTRNTVDFGRVPNLKFEDCYATGVAAVKQRRFPIRMHPTKPRRMAR